MRKIIAPIAGLILILLIAVVGYKSYQGSSAQHAAQAVVNVHGIVGSEKQDFFNDPAVIAEFQHNGINLKIDTEGSRDQALTASADGADFYFPAGEPAGRALAKRLNIKNASTPFYTPIVIASWEPIANILEQNGIVKKTGAYWYVVNMQKLLAIVKSDERWSDLPHNTAYPVNKHILISSTDARKSNSADMYLALASYLFNNNEVVTTSTQQQKIQHDIDGLFLRQGYQESSSSGPFDDYVSIGMGKAPMVLVYEQQFVEYLVEHPASDRPAGMVLLYPKPTIFTKHTIVPTNEHGAKVATLLETDDILKTLEMKHGFRTNDAAKTNQIWKSEKVDLPSQILDVIDPPSFETLETMIRGVSAAYDKQ